MEELGDPTDLGRGSRDARLSGGRFESGHSVLPQFGWVAFGLGAMLPAGIFIAIAARTPALLPRWLGLASYPIAVLVCLTAFLFMLFVLFVLWVIAVTASQRRARLGA